MTGTGLEGAAHAIADRVRRLADAFRRVLVREAVLALEAAGRALRADGFGVVGVFALLMVLRFVELSSLWVRWRLGTRRCIHGRVPDP